MAQQSAHAKRDSPLFVDDLYKDETSPLLPARGSARSVNVGNDNFADDDDFGKGFR